MTGGAGFSRDAQNTSSGNHGLRKRAREIHFLRTKRAWGLGKKPINPEKMQTENEQLKKKNRAYTIKFLIVLAAGLISSLLILYWMF